MQREVFRDVREAVLDMLVYANTHGHLKKYNDDIQQSNKEAKIAARNLEKERKRLMDGSLF